MILGYLGFDLSKVYFMNNNLNSHDIPTALFADCLANSKDIFQLIDQVFPVDSCRHYKVLPLKLEEKNLVLGMIDPQNEESLKFVQSIANVFQYNLSLNLIDMQTHQIVLASYPESSQQRIRSQSKDEYNQTVIDSNFNGEAIPLSSAQRKRRNLGDSAPTIISVPKEEQSNSIVKDNSGLEDLPPDFDFLKDLDLTSNPSPTINKPSVDSTATLYEIPPEFINQRPTNNQDDKPTIIGVDPAELLAQSQEKPETEISFGEAQISALINEAISEAGEISANYLPDLQSQLSWPQLLEQAYAHHTDQIRLVRHSGFGSIETSKNNELQSGIDELPLPTFCSLIDEIKRMARLPQNTSSHPRKVVLERIHNEERILIRLEFLTEKEQQIVVVQILRGQILKVYEQKQMDRMSEQTLQLARQLEKALRKIQVGFDSAKINNLKDLQAVQSRINHQLRLLDQM